MWATLLKSFKDIDKVKVRALAPRFAGGSVVGRWYGPFWPFAVCPLSARLAPPPTPRCPPTPRAHERRAEQPFHSGPTRALPCPRASQPLFGLQDTPDTALDEPVDAAFAALALETTPHAEVSAVMGAFSASLIAC